MRDKPNFFFSFTCLFKSIQFEEAAKETADEVTRPRPEEEEDVQDIQIMLKSEANPIAIRNLKVSVVGFGLHVILFLFLWGPREKRLLMVTICTRPILKAF